MKRLNLLPPELRPRGGNVRTRTYAVLGGLLAATLGMVVFGFVQAGITSTGNEIKRLQDETVEAKEHANALGPYAEFAAMKDARDRAVRVVAGTRFDYERLTRELTRILPEHVWVTGLDVGPAEADPDAGADSAAAAAAAEGFTVSVSGCAPDQPTVADTLDRLGALTGATGVELGASGDGSASGGSSGQDSLLVEGASSGGGSCTAGMGAVSFQASVAVSGPTEEGTDL